MELHTQTSCVFIFGATFFGFFALLAMAVGTAEGWIIGGVLMLLPLSLVIMSRRGVTVEPAKRRVVHHNGIGPIKLLKRTFDVDNSCEVVLLDYGRGYTVYVREGERQFNLLMTYEGSEAEELARAVADELQLKIVDRYETRGSKGVVLDSHEQPHEPSDG